MTNVPSSLFAARSNPDRCSQVISFWIASLRSQRRHLFFLCVMGSLANIAMASSFVEARLSLQRLDVKIHQLKQQLASAQDQQSELQNSLAEMDKKIADTARQLDITTRLTKEKYQKINTLKAQSQTLSERLALQQAILATYIRARYRIGRDELLRAFLSSDNLDETHQQIVYFSYILRAHKQLITVMRETKQQLVHTQKELEAEYKNYAALKIQLASQQKRLETNKQIQLNIMENLANNIHHDRRTLQDYEYDKTQLAVLLTKLTINSHEQVMPRRYAPHRKTVLTSPLTSNASMKRWNQGILFIAPEGTAVHAVKAGRVVFSDWLRGYGLLLILDHGHGLMTLYGYNQALFKRRGQWVAAGDQIATVGRSGVYREQGLYFEARRDGRVIGWPESETA